MLLSNSSLVKLYQYYIVLPLMKYPKCTLCLVCAFSLVFITINYFFTRVSGTSHLYRPLPLFDPSSGIIDINDGSLDKLSLLLESSSLQFIIYYATWCVRSRDAVFEFHKASLKYQGQVSFTAINCGIGSCRITNQFPYYPQLFFYHTKYEPILFTGKIKSNYLMRFVENILYPFQYISNNSTLQEILYFGRPSLIGYFNALNYQNKKYDHFFGAALQSVDQVSPIYFGIITSHKLAFSLGFKSVGEVVLINPMKTPQPYPHSLNFTASMLSEWVDINKIQYVQELRPDIIDTDVFRTVIKENPVMILFVPQSKKGRNKHLITLYHKLSLKYHNCSCETNNAASSQPLKTSCQSYVTQSFSSGYHHSNICDVCHECPRAHRLCDASFYPLNLSTLLNRRYLVNPPNNSCRSLSTGYYQSASLSLCCFESKYREVASGSNTLPSSKRFENGNFLSGLFDELVGIFGGKTSKETAAETQEYHVYGTCEKRGKVREFTGAGCFSNVTVTFSSMDSRRFWKYARALGVKDNPSRIALSIVDAKNEAQFVHPEDEPITSDSIIDFVMNFTRGNLTRRLRSAPVPTQSCSGNSGCVIEVVTSTFNHYVLDGEKDVLLMYYTTWCGFCKSAEPAFVEIADYYRKDNGIRISRINADINDLHWEYAVDSYPSFVLFPAKRKDLSRVFPDNMQVTLPNLVNFVEKYRNVHAGTGHVSTRERHVTPLKVLQQQKTFLRHENVILRSRLRHEVKRRVEAEKRRLAAERKLSGISRDGQNSQRQLSQAENELRKLRHKNDIMSGELNRTKKILRSQYEKLTAVIQSLKRNNSELLQAINKSREIVEK